VWRHDGLLDSAALADRVRWQLDGWLTGSAIRARASAGRFETATHPTAGIDRLRLVPDGLVRYAGMQPGLWGELGEADARAHRALVRVQGLLGPESVFTAVLGGGRGYAERVHLVPWGDERREPGSGPRARCAAGQAGSGPRARCAADQTQPQLLAREAANPPWPGRLPTPAPATVLTQPVAVTVRTADGASLRIDERLEPSGEPATVQIGREPPGVVTGWAGPWPVQERWWAPDDAVVLIRLQLGLADGRALLVAQSGDDWQLEAVYD
jgi:protein ImuB